MITELIEFFILRIAFPMVMEIIRKRELDPAFKVRSDQLFSDWKNAVTTDQRKLVARRLYELQKS